MTLAQLFRRIGLPTLVMLLMALAVDSASADLLDPTFTNSPQFHQKAWPGRVTSGPSGKVYVTYVNGGSLVGTNNQRRGEVLRLNADGAIDQSFNVGPQFTEAWAVIEQANGQVLVGGLDSNESYDLGQPLYRVFRLNSNGTRDTSYQSPVFVGLPRFMTLQPDGKLLVVSQFAGTTNGGIGDLQRLNSDGSLDTTFSPTVLPAGSEFFANIVVDSSNRILVGGTFTTIAGQPRPGIARLLSDGALDSTFVPSGFTLTGSRTIRGIGIQTQGANAGKIVITGGTLRTSTGTQTTCPAVGNTTSSNCALLRLNADGSLDTGFTLVATSATGGVIPARGRLLNILPGDKMLAVEAGVARFNADGSIDTTYNKPVFSLETFWMDALADGRVYVPITDGSTVNGIAAPQQVMRFNSDGSADAAFAPSTFQREIYPDDLAPLADGRFLTWGDFDTVGAVARSGAARFNADGTLDTSYAITGIANLLGIYNAGVLSDGRLLGWVTTGLDRFSTSGTALVRFTTTGATDPTYIPDSMIAAKASSLDLKVLPDGKALVWDTPTPDSVFSANAILFKRLGLDGALDNSFIGLTGADGLFGAAFPDVATPSIAVGAFSILGRYADGRLIAAATTGPYLKNATSFNYTLLRLNADGTLDNTFVAPSVTWTTIYQGFTAGTLPDGKQHYATYVSGSPFKGVLPQTDGSLIVYGSFTTLGGQAAAGIARLTSSGALDAAFSVGTGAELRNLPGRSAQVKHVTTDANGKYWVSGQFDTFGGNVAPGLARLNADSTADSTFSSPLAYRNYVGGNTRVVFDAANRPMVLGTFLPSADGFPDAIHRLALPGPTGLTVAVPATLQSSGSTKLVATASYAIGASKLVNPNWTSSNPAAATVSPAGILTTASVTVNTSVTITATYSENGNTVTATSFLTVTAAPAALSSLAIVGKASVPAGAQVLLVASATYSDSSTREVASASWSVAPSNLGAVDSRGRFTAGAVSVDSDATITANYTEGVITRSATQVVRISAAPAVLQGLTIIGAQGTLASGQSLALSAFGNYADGSRKAASTTTWQVNGNAASISSSGVLTANAVTVDTPAVVSASYTEAGVSVRAQYLIVVQATAIVSPIAVEVESTGPREASSLALWSSLSLPASAAAVRDARAARPTYNMYIVALVPAGPLTSSPVIFLLNRSKQWEALGFPLAEYLSGVSEGSFQLVSIFEKLDASILSGTQIFVGYGTSDQEMINTGRFRMVTQVQ